jgi:hypothetical protein
MTVFANGQTIPENTALLRMKIGEIDAIPAADAVESSQPKVTQAVFVDAHDLRLYKPIFNGEIVVDFDLSGKSGDNEYIEEKPP